MIRDKESKGKIPRHGLVRKKEFELVEQTDNSVTFAIEDDENSYQNYPYHFRLRNHLYPYWKDSTDSIQNI